MLKCYNSIKSEEIQKIFKKLKTDIDKTVKAVDKDIVDENPDIEYLKARKLMDIDLKGEIKSTSDINTFENCEGIEVTDNMKEALKMNQKMCMYNKVEVIKHIVNAEILATQLRWQNRSEWKEKRSYLEGKK